MELSRLDPGRDYSESDLVTYYHGINAYQIDPILDRGSIVSERRRETEGYDLMVTHLHEDIIRHAGSEITEISLHSGEKIREYLDENREDLIEEGSSQTQWLAGEQEPYLQDGLDFIGSVVWLSRDRREACNYSAKRRPPGCESESGGYFKFLLPEETFLDLGLNSGVPGEVPLEFAEELHLENTGKEEGLEIFLDFKGAEYDIDIRGF